MHPLLTDRSGVRVCRISPPFSERAPQPPTVPPTDVVRATMISRVGLRANQSTRSFKVSARALNSVFGTPQTGTYSNLPFPVKTKRIRFAIGFYGTATLFFAIPFMTCYWHLKKAGNL